MSTLQYFCNMSLFLFDLNTGNWDLTVIIFVVSHTAVWNECRKTISRLMCHQLFLPILQALLSVIMKIPHNSDP